MGQLLTKRTPNSLSMLLTVEHAVDCLVNKIGEIAWAAQLVCLKPSWVQEFRARGSCQFFRFDI